MDILLTVVLGYIDYQTTLLHTKVSSEVFKYNGARMRVNEAISTRVEDIRKDWSNKEPAYRNVISISHSII